MTAKRKHGPVKALLILLLLSPVLKVKCQTPMPVKALMSNQAADAVGMNTHISFGNTMYVSHYEDIIKPRLVELGTKHIRDHFGNETANARYAELAHQFGIKLLLIDRDNGMNLTTTRDEVKRLNQLDPTKPVVDMIEPANERDNGWKQNWPRLCTYTAELYKLFKADAATTTIPILGPSFANTRNSAVDMGKVCTNAADNMDMGNLHAYSGLYPESPFAGGWGISFDKAIESYRTISSTKPLIESESGYKMSEGAKGHPAVSEHTAAKYSPRLVLERLRRGVNRLYFYQLINSGEDFAILNNDGTPRQQFISLKNFIHLMADEGTDFTPGELSYSLTGDTKDIYQMLFEKRNGKFMLVIWQGINGSAGGTKNNDYTDIENPDKKITLNLAKKAATVKIYRPSFDKMPDGNGIAPIAKLKNKSTIDLSVPDHVLIVEIAPKGK